MIFCELSVAKADKNHVLTSSKTANYILTSSTTVSKKKGSNY